MPAPALDRRLNVEGDETMPRTTPSPDTDELAGFEADLDRLGADVAAWPRRARARAQALLPRSADARALLAQQHSLDQALTALREHPVPTELAARILSRVPAGNSPARPANGGAWERCWAWLGGALWRPALTACAPLLLGYVLGAALPTAADRQAADQFSALASTAIYEEFFDADR